MNKLTNEEQHRWDMESAMMHMQKANERLVKIVALAWIVTGLLIGLVAYVLLGYNISTEAVTIDSHQGTANYIGNDGDITNGRD